jgi:hypothetical protein
VFKLVIEWIAHNWYALVLHCLAAHSIATLLYRLVQASSAAKAPAADNGSTARTNSDSSTTASATADASTATDAASTTTDAATNTDAASTANAATATSDTVDSSADADTEPDTDAVASSQHSVKYVYDANMPILWQALHVMAAHKCLPLDLACASKAAHKLVSSSVPVKVNISAGMTAPTLFSVLRRSCIQHVHINGTGVGGEVKAAIAVTLPPQPSSQQRVVHTRLWQQPFAECTIENFEQWDMLLVQGIVESLPKSVRTLTLALQQPQSEEASYYILQCPQRVETLTLRNIDWAVEHSPVLRTLYYEGHTNCVSDLPASLRSLYIRDCAELPLRLTAGVQLVDMLHTAGHAALPAMPDTVTALRLPLDYQGALGALPPLLEVLHTGHMFNGYLGDLPATLRSCTSSAAQLRCTYRMNMTLVSYLTVSRC